jgi:hypothetical protein
MRCGKKRHWRAANLCSEHRFNLNKNRPSRSHISGHRFGFGQLKKASNVVPRSVVSHPPTTANLHRLPRAFTSSRPVRNRIQCWCTGIEPRFSVQHSRIPPPRWSAVRSSLANSVIRWSGTLEVPVSAVNVGPYTLSTPRVGRIDRHTGNGSRGRHRTARRGFFRATAVDRRRQAA